MDKKTLQEIAAEAQNLARDLSPYQNVPSLALPTYWVWWVVGKLFPSRKRRLKLSPKEITLLVNSLLNAGNALEKLTRDLPDDPPQEKP